MAEQDAEDITKPEQTEEELLENIQGRLEDLLSKQNFAEDAFIQQHVNAQMYIPLCVLACHHYISSAGADVGQLLAAARRSEKLAVHEDGLMVRPKLKSKRNTLILREIPEGADEEEIQKLFDKSPEKDKVLVIKPDINQTMFVTFKTDEAAQNAALWLQSQKIRGENVKCAVKSEHLLRSFFPAGPTIPQQHYAMPQMWPQAQWNGGQGPWLTNVPGGQQGEGYIVHQDFGYMTGGMGGGWDSSGMDGKGGKGRHRGGSKGKGKGSSRQRARSSGPTVGGSFSAGAAALGAIPIQPSSTGGIQVFQDKIGSAEHFPALTQRVEAPSTKVTAAPGIGEGTSEVDELEPRYNHEFRKFSRQALIEVCNRMEEIKKPDSYEKFEKAAGPQHENAIMFRNSPCKDWAPLPTPAASFASAVFGDRNGEEQGESGEGGYGRRRASSQEHWGRRSHSRSGDRDENRRTSWNAGDAWAGADWSGGAERRAKSRDRDRTSSSWDDTSFAQRGSSRSPYIGPQWVAKKPEKDPREPSADAAGGGKAMSWAEKVKSGGSEPQQKWVPKKDTKDSTSADGAAAAAAAPAAAASEVPAERKERSGGPPDKQPRKAAATPRGEEGGPTTPGAPSAQTWADKMRQSRSP